ncbi:MAG: glycosyltransferase family 2 protein [Armatimonadia bacterium]
MAQPRVEKLVGVVTVNWNGAADTLGCLASLRESEYAALEVVVCDNASTDDSVARIEAEYPEVTVVQAGANLGWCGGVNRGAQVALGRGCEYLLILNNDTVLPPDLIGEMVAAIENGDRVGLVTARERLYHNPQRGDRLGARFRPLVCMVEWLFADEENREALPPVLKMDCVSCCAAMASREVVEKVGLLDEAFFVYWEDVDWSLRVRAAGYQNLCLTDTMVVHKSGASMEDGAGLSLPQLYYVCRGQAMTARKHARGLGRVLAPARLLGAAGLTAMKGLVRPGYRKEMRTKLRAFRDGWFLREAQPPR